MFLVEHAQQFFFLNDKQGSWGNGHCGAHPKRLTRHAALAKEVGRTKHRDDRLLSRAIHDRQLHAAFLNVHHSFRGIALRIDRFVTPVLRHFSRYTSSVEKSLCVEIEIVLRDCFFLWFHISGLEALSAEAFRSQIYVNRVASAKTVQNRTARPLQNPYDVVWDGEAKRHWPVWAGRAMSLISPFHLSG